MSYRQEKSRGSLKAPKYIQRLAALFVILSLTGRHADGTSIAITANTREIVVAADSKVYESNEKLCKIFKVGSVYWAMSGIMDNAITDYSVANIVKESYSPGESLEQLLDAFMKNVSLPLAKTIVHDYNFRKRFEIIRNNPLEIAFWSFKGGTPIIASVSYRVTVAGDQLTVAPYDQRIVNCSNQRLAYVILLGVRGEIARYVKIHPDWGKNLIASAHHFVVMSINERPQSVGYPISELIIKRDGTYHWIKPNKYCHRTLCEGPPPESIPTK